MPKSLLKTYNLKFEPMMQLTLDPEKFLTQHWQKKPLYIQGAFPDFRDPLDADQLAGMALRLTSISSCKSAI